MTKTGFAAIALAVWGITPPLIAQEYEEKVAKAAQSAQEYSRQALSRQLEGSAQVKLVILADGSIESVNLVQSTGSVILDRDILANTRNMALPPLPAGQDRADIVLPISYRLVEGRADMAVNQDRAESLEAWKAAARERIRATQNYPQSLRYDEVQGDVSVRVNVDSEGHIRGADLIDSSGSNALDREALATVQRHSALPPLPEGTQAYSFLLTLKYRLE